MKGPLNNIIKYCDTLLQAILPAYQAVKRNGKVNEWNVFDPFKFKPAFVPQKANRQSIIKASKTKPSQW